MFDNLANSFIGNNINEAAITTQETTEQITGVIKQIINDLSEIIAKFNQQAPLYVEQVNYYINNINEQIKEELKGKPVPIVFKMLKPNVLGSYNFKQKFIQLNASFYLLEQINEFQKDVPLNEQRLFKLKDINSIDFEGIDETIGHELIHQQQDERSGGKLFNKRNKSYEKLLKKYDTNKNNKLDKDEIDNISQEDQNQQFVEILNKKNKIAPKMSDDKFLERVKYLNTEAELNTWAKDTVQKYVKQTYDDMYQLAKQNNTAENYSAEQMKSKILAPFINAAETNVFSNQLQNNLISQA